MEQEFSGVDMNNKLIDRRKDGLLAGVSLLLMAVAAGFSFGYVYSGMVIPDQDSQTMANLSEGMGLFRAGAWGWVLVLILDVVVAVALYRYFKPVHAALSALAGALRLVYSAILAWAISHLFTAMGQVISGADAAEVITSLNTFEGIWSGGLVVFGLHLIGLGMLSLRSGFVPRLWGWLLVVAGLSYTGVHGARVLLPGMEAQVQQAEILLSLPMALGELGFAIWLIYAFFRTRKPAV